MPSFIFVSSLLLQTLQAAKRPALAGLAPQRAALPGMLGLPCPRELVTAHAAPARAGTALWHSSACSSPGRGAGKRLSSSRAAHRNHGVEATGKPLKRCRARGAMRGCRTVTHRQSAPACAPGPALVHTRRCDRPCKAEPAALDIGAISVPKGRQTCPSLPLFDRRLDNTLNNIL